jgi:hypothetical protein
MQAVLILNMAVHIFTMGFKSLIVMSLDALRSENLNASFKKPGLKSKNFETFRPL